MSAIRAIKPTPSVTVKVSRRIQSTRALQEYRGLQDAFAAGETSVGLSGSGLSNEGHLTLRSGKYGTKILTVTHKTVRSPSEWEQVQIVYLSKGDRLERFVRYSSNAAQWKAKISFSVSRIEEEVITGKRLLPLQKGEIAITIRGLFHFHESGKVARAAIIHHPELRLPVNKRWQPTEDADIEIIRRIDGKDYHFIQRELEGGKICWAFIPLKEADPERGTDKADLARLAGLQLARSLEKLKDGEIAITTTGISHFRGRA